MKDIEIFTDIGLSEEDINNKYPEQDEPSIIDIMKEYAVKYKIIVVPVLLMILIYLFDNDISSFPVKQSGGFIQSGGDGENVAAAAAPKSSGYLSKAASPVSSTFNIVMGTVRKLFSLVSLIITAILIPTIPILVYCGVAYYVIKKFLFMITSLK